MKLRLFFLPIICLVLITLVGARQVFADCNPGDQCGTCEKMAQCQNGAACGSGHQYCVYKADGNYCGDCVQEVNNCSEQCPENHQSQNAGNCNIDQYWNGSQCLTKIPSGQGGCCSWDGQCGGGTCGIGNGACVSGKSCGIHSSLQSNPGLPPISRPIPPPPSNSCLPGCCGGNCGSCPNDQSCTISNGACSSGISCDPNSGTKASPSPRIAPAVVGDVDGNGCLNVKDFNAWVYAFQNNGTEQQSNYNADLNGDGEIDLLDFAIWFQANSRGQNKCN